MNILKKLTNRYLMLNKKRTIVTIIGIIISAAMITAVATLATTFQRFMLDVEISQNGRWEAIFENVKKEDIENIETNDKFAKTMKMAEISMAQNPYTRYEFIRIYGYDKESMENVETIPIEGRMPENENEIALSQTFFDGSEDEPKIGDEITFSFGKRISENGFELKSEPKESNEKFEITESKTFKLVGKIHTPSFESQSDNYTAGITILTNEMIDNIEFFDIGIISKNPEKLYEDTEKIADELLLYEDIKYDENNIERIYNIKYNTRILMYMGVSDDLGFSQMIYSVCGVLITVIIIGSILVIYNSFAISVSERKKQFGMLSSIGATKKQIRKSVLYEGAYLGLIAIPIGIILGILGIGITLKIVDNLLIPLFANTNWHIQLTISWETIIIAALLVALTIYISVLIPAKRASKITPIEAIRQVDDIKIKPKKLKTPKFVRKLFKIPGDLALKNLKRSRKKYRTTVISLIISIVLFISVSGFVDYMSKGFDSMYFTYDFDIGGSVYGENKEEKEKIVNEIAKIPEINEFVYENRVYVESKIPENKISKNLKEIIDEKSNGIYYMYDEDSKTYNLRTNIIELDDVEFERYTKELGINSLDDNQVILINKLNLLLSYNIETEIINNIETITTEDNTILNIAKITNQYPKLLPEDGYNISITLICNENLLSNLGLEEEITNAFYISTEESNKVVEQIEKIQDNFPDVELFVSNISEQLQMQNNLKLVIQIFLYGFIVLISAIGIANIFNTISTNILLRRREFANLKSVGMTDKQFKKMLNLECFFYGTKALLYGLPIGIFICFLLNLSFSNAVRFIFVLPWDAIIISVISVYIIVFVTMIYSSKKVKRENIIDVLRDDNI